MPASTPHRRGSSDILGMLGVEWPDVNQQPLPPAPGSPQLLSLDEAANRQSGPDPFLSESEGQPVPSQQQQQQQQQQRPSVPESRVAGPSTSAPLTRWEQTQLSQLSLASPPAQDTAKRKDA